MEHLIEKVPEFLNENIEINAFFDAVEPELILLNTRMSQLKNNIFPETADANGIKQYEDWLGISYDRTLNLYDRRIEVLARLNETLPYTEIRLQHFLAGIVGWGNFEYFRDGAFVKVSVNIAYGRSIMSLIEMLDRVLPLNLHYQISERAEEKNDVEIGSACHVLTKIVVNTTVEV